jgi:hypothetical protein
MLLPCGLSKYEGNIATYLTRLHDLNLTVHLTGKMYRRLVYAAMPAEFTRQIHHELKRHTNPTDDEFDEAVRTAGEAHEDTLLKFELQRRSGKVGYGSLRERMTPDSRRTLQERASSPFGQSSKLTSRNSGGNTGGWNNQQK